MVFYQSHLLSPDLCLAKQVEQIFMMAGITDVKVHFGALENLKSSAM